MTFSIARQPLVPAFLTLVVLTAAVMCRIVGADPAMGTAFAPAITMLPVTAIGDFQAENPAWSYAITGLLILFTGLCLGRISTRYGLYASNSCLAIPLYGIIACGALPQAEYLSVCIGSMLMALAMQNLCRACQSGYAFDPMFRAGLYLGLLPFVSPPALPLLLLVPLASLLLQRTLREFAVSIAGALLPGLFIGYLAWGQGYRFKQPLTELWSLFSAGEPLQFFTSTPLWALGFIGGILLLTLAAILLFLANAYTSGSKPRLILTYNISAFLLTAALLSVPSATPGVILLLAIPAALLLPVLFVRIHHAIATPVYLILLAGTFLSLFLT